MTERKYDIRIRTPTGVIVNTTAWGRDQYEAQDRALRMHAGTVIGCRPAP